MTHTIYIALGTNLGDRAENLKAARKALDSKLNLLNCSPIYETPPWGYAEQPAFLNQVVKGETSDPPLELLSHLKEVEAQMGREKTIRNGPRIIDLDILFYDDLVFNTPELAIPHPRMPGRAFVLVPLADLAPELCHPVLGKNIRDMLAETENTGISRWSDSDGRCEAE